MKSVTENMSLPTLNGKTLEGYTVPKIIRAGV